MATPAKDLVALTLEDGHRPFKRPRTEDSESIDNVAERLGRCLEAQVFPHVERATAQLPADVYDIDKLGAKVITIIVDKGFEQKFHEGRGRLTSTAELTIAAGIHRLVTELAAGPHYRHSSPIPPLPPLPPTDRTEPREPIGAPTILPSIEQELNDDASEVEADYAGSDDLGYEDEEEVDEGASEVVDEESDFYEEAQLAALQSEFESEPEREPEFKFEKSPQPIQIRTPPLQTRKTKKKKKKNQQISPQQFRTRARAFQWQSGKSFDSAGAASSKMQHRFNLPVRPYLSASQRQQARSLVANARLPRDEIPPSAIFHVDFSHHEIRHLQRLARILYGRPFISGQRSISRDLRNILKKVPAIRYSLIKIHGENYVGYDAPPASLTKRSPGDVTNFLDDLYGKKVEAIPTVLSIEQSDPLAQTEASRAGQMPKLLLSREIMGNKLGWSRTYSNFITSVRCIREDYLEPQVEWTNCAGDIMTISWLSNTEFLCGTTTHSDSHNQQYNKPGNLLLGSTVTNTLRAYPDHRVVRPRVSSGENASESMVASQDPWLFTSVVSSDYDPSYGLAFTSSFDKTVKVWKPQDGSMVALGTWKHEGRVNFVVTSKNSSGTVATAADVPTEAVRVYHLDPSNVSGSRYDSYSCTRVHDEDYTPSDKWAYYPAAIRWGLAPEVKHLLLIGYSPRSPTGEDNEIPEDKMNTGELCLWDTSTRTQVKVNSAKTQNVFEVAWHPSCARFAAATSASQTLEKSDQLARTQIRVFELNDAGQYTAIKTLDCAAVDINELSIMPNCLNYSYIAASCTDGKVYVWDTAGSDLPMCVLEHGEPVEELLGEREEEDVGVKFTAWATTADRLYTGSSDGVVKVWNIRHGRCVLIRDLIEVAAPITHGAFSPDFTKLVIGDGSGRVYLLALEDPEDVDPTPDQGGKSEAFLNVQTSSGQQLAIRRPRPFIPHPELPPPGEQGNQSELMAGQDIGRGYLNTGQLVVHPNPTIGVVQGSNYEATGLFRKEAHLNDDPNQPLLSSFQPKQQESYQSSRPLDHGLNVFRRQQDKEHSSEEVDKSTFSSNLKHPLISEECCFDPSTWQELVKEKAELDDRLIDLDYETSIFDSEDEYYEP